VELGKDDAVRDPTVFSKNRDRLLKGDIARKFMHSVLKPAAGPGSHYGGLPNRLRALRRR
jgi:hypothetical protein